MNIRWLRWKLNLSDAVGGKSNLHFRWVNDNISTQIDFGNIAATLTLSSGRGVVGRGCTSSELEHIKRCILARLNSDGYIRWTDGFHTWAGITVWTIDLEFVSGANLTPESIWDVNSRESPDIERAPSSCSISPSTSEETLPTRSILTNSSSTL